MTKTVTLVYNERRRATTVHVPGETAHTSPEPDGLEGVRRTGVLYGALGYRVELEIR